MKDQPGKAVFDKDIDALLAHRIAAHSRASTCDDSPHENTASHTGTARCIPAALMVAALAALAIAVFVLRGWVHSRCRQRSHGI